MKYTGLSRRGGVEVTEANASRLHFATVLLHGQTLAATGSITGTVADSTGAAVPEARVTARNEDTLGVLTAKTGPDGRFYFSTLPIGSYTLRVEKPGFTGVMVSRFLLSVGEVSVHEIQLPAFTASGQ